MKLVIVVRKDLNMRKGKMSAQVGHACSSLVWKNGDKAEVRKWMASGQTKIVVGVADEDTLRSVWSRAARDGLWTTDVIDAGRTEFNGVPTLTCVAVGPAEDDRVDAITGELPLL